MNLTSKTLVVQKEGFVTSDMDKEKVMLNMEKGKYYNLGEVGGQIWELIKSPGRTMEQIVTELQKEYDLSQEQCQKEVTAFIEKLQQEGIIEIKE